MTQTKGKIDQELDIGGHLALINTRDLDVEEASFYGGVVDTGTGDTIGGAAPTMTLADAGASFDDTMQGQFLQLESSTTPANDGVFLILSVQDANNLTYANAAGVAEAFAGTWTIRRSFSLADQMEFHNTDRRNIKGTASHVTDVPVYQRPDAIGTDVPANLTNIAGKTLDAFAKVISRKFENIAFAEGNTLVTLTDAGNLKHADAVNRLGVPIEDGADAGNDEATYTELIDDATGQAITADGRAVGDVTVVAGANLVDGETLVIDDGTNPAVTFEIDDDASVVESATLRAITITGAETATQIRDLFIAAINEPTLTLNMLASINAAAVFDLVNTVPGVAGNQALVETVTDAGFVVNGMAGGTALNGYRIYGRTQAGGSTSPNTVEVALRAVPIGSPLSASVAYTWEKLNPATMDVFYPFRQRCDLITETEQRTTLVHGVIGDAGIAQALENIRDAVGISVGDTDLDGLLTNLGDFFPFAGLDNTPDVVEALNILNEQIGDRNYTGAILTDGETVTDSLQALSDAIGGASVTRIIQRHGADVNAFTPITIPGGATFTPDGTNNGANLTLYHRKQLFDPGPISNDDTIGGNDYAEGAGPAATQVTLYTKVKSGDHTNYFIYQ